MLDSSHAPAAEQDRPAASGYVFGPFRMDVSSYQLTRDGQKVDLATKSFDTLHILVRHRHRVVVKEELLAAVWPDTVVSDDSLIQSISALRRAIGDDATNPRYVATVARRGYRFIAPVSEWTQPLDPAVMTTHAAAGAVDEVPSDGDTSSAPVRTQWRKRALTAALGACLLVAGWAAGRLTTSPSPDVVSAGLLRFNQPAPPGTRLASGGALAPSGTHIAFASEDTESGRAHLWVRPLDGDRPQLLEGTDGAARPFWSPDSQFIGFFADGRLKTVRLSGGSPTDLVTVGPRPSGGAWGGNGTQVIFSTWLSGLSRVSTAGGPPSKLTELATGDVAHAWPQFLPDGDHFLYSAISSGGTTRIIVGRLSDISLREVVLEADAGAVYSPTGHLVFTRSGILSAQGFDASTLQLRGEPFSIVAGNVTSPSMTNGTMLSVAQTGVLAFGGATGESELAWFDRGGRPSGTLSTAVPLHNPALSADGTQVFGNTYRPSQSGVWVADIYRGATIRLVPDGSMPMPSPDGRTIAFSAAREPNATALLTRPLDEDRAEDSTVVQDAARKAVTDWSRDGTLLIYQAFVPGAGQDILSVARAGGQAPVAHVKSAANEIQGRLSPDGRWLAYASDESGRWEVYVQGFPAGNQRQTISPAGGSEPQWRADGRELFYLAADHTIMAVPVTPGNVLSVSKPQPLFRPQVLGEATTYRSHFAASRNGQRFLVDVLREPALDPIHVLMNWTRR